MAPQTVQDGLVVSLTYVLKLDDGEVIDAAGADEPLLYLHGADNIIPGLERELTGMGINESKQVTVAPENGYGEYEEEAVQELPRDMFPADAELAVDAMLTLRDEEGRLFDVTVADLDDDTVTLDFNHPLAGETLYFDVTVIALREPTAEERAHGHPHVPGMHAH